MSNGNIIVSAGDNLEYDPVRSVYRKTFPYPYTAVEGVKIALKTVDIYYSWFSITNAFNNRNFAYTWVDGVTYNVVIDEGFYTASDIDAYLRYAMRANGHYLVNANQQEVYYLSLIPNQVYNKIQVVATAVPTSLPSGWTYGGASFPLNGHTPQLQILGSNNFGLLIGFPSGTYPATQTGGSMSILSSFTPQISPVLGAQILCNWVSDNRFTLKPSVIASFTPNGTFGSLLTVTPPVINYYPVIPKTYSYIELQFVDQNYNPLQMTDALTTSVTLEIQDPRPTGR